MNKEKKLNKNVAFVIMCVVAYLLIVGIVWAAINIPGAITRITENNAIKNSKVVLYDGPKSLQDATLEDLSVVSEAERDMSLKHSVDTKVLVNGKESYVYETNVNNGRTWVGSYMPDQSRTPLTYFDFDGTVEITVKVPRIILNH